MRAWPVQDAKARFSEMFETRLKEGPQMVTKRGAESRGARRLRMVRNLV
jgi:hypothetical protein